MTKPNAETAITLKSTSNDWVRPILVVNYSFHIA